MSSPVTLRTRAATIGSQAVQQARLRVVPNVRTRAPRLPFVLVVGMVLLGGIVGLLMFNTSMMQSSFAASALQAQAENLTAREETLRMEVERLRNPQRVAEAAKKLGMVEPGAPAFLRLDGRIQGVATPADLAQGVRIKDRPQPLPASLRGEVRVKWVDQVPAKKSAPKNAAAKNSAANNAAATKQKKSEQNSTR